MIIVETEMFLGVAEGLKIRGCTYQYKGILMEQVLLLYLAIYIGAGAVHYPGHPHFRRPWTINEDRLALLPCCNV